jgi:porin
VNVSFLGAGLLIQGIVPRRPLDLLVLGAGRAAGLGTGDEGMVELGYQWQINRNLALQPTLQWIIHPSGASPTPPGILAAGLQISLTF